MEYNHRPAEWKTLYPDCPIGVRITDLWLNELEKPFVDVVNGKYESRPVYITINGVEHYCVSICQAAKLSKLDKKSVYIRLNSGREINGIAVRIA